MEQLPNPDVEVPHEKRLLMRALRKEREGWLGALASAADGSYDGQRNVRQAKANINKLLDHYPNGSPRDHIVAYDGIDPFEGIPDNVLLGQD